MARSFGAFRVSVHSSRVYIYLILLLSSCRFISLPLVSRTRRKSHFITVDDFVGGCSEIHRHLHREERHSHRVIAKSCCGCARSIVLSRSAVVETFT